ncbi:MAG: hypothetical protein H8E27_01750 [Verrucomicrobia subdivision 3 bacterium]|nr:hypothetical protein [Limisphaerales bacterium]
MTSLPTQSTDTTGTDAFDLMTPAKPASEDQGFDKVFREAAGEAEVAEQEKAAEDKVELQVKEEAARQKKRANEFAGLGHASPLQADLASKAKVNPSEGKQVATNAPAEEGAQKLLSESKLLTPKVDPKAKVNIETQSDGAKEELKAMQARKQSAAKQTGRLKKQQAARAQLKSEDVKQATAKAELEADRQNLPTATMAKGAAVKPAQSTDKTGNLPEGDWEIVNGTQFAQNNPKMAMMAKTTPLAPEGSVARWEELRPATSAELGGGASSQQQDLPREQARELTAPVQAVATPAATGTAATQAFTPVPGQISATLEKIWNAVTTFRAKGADQMTVKLQTENQQMELTIRYNQGGLEIQARLGQGEGQQLAGQWNELQQSLAERGVTLRDLAREEAELPRFSDDLDDFNPSESRRHASAGEDDEEPLNWGELENNRDEEEQSAPRRATARAQNVNWESWA